MKFSELDLDPKILQAIEKCGYNKPTPIQTKAIPSLLSGKDLVASAQTGTGKTAAYVLPALQLLLTKKSTSKSKPRILILAPTRELAGQITKVIGKYGSFMKVNIASFVGGVPYNKQLRELSRPIDIIIATPGRLMDHMENKRLDLSHIEMLIIDEADRMLDMGFIDDIKTIVKVTPENRQTILTSATVDDQLTSAMKNLLKNPVKINISQEKIDIKLIQQKIHMVSDTNRKDLFLERIIDEENIFKAIIFSATKIKASKLAMKLSDAGYSAAAMHGDLKQSARNRTLTSFRQGKIQFLVATDVAARGIDVTDISHVINYDLPKFSEDYVHRIGRTGRAGKTGHALSIAVHSEIYQIRKIERYIGYKIKTVQITQHGEQDWIPEEGSASKKESRSPKRKSRYSSKQKDSNNKKSGSKRKPTKIRETDKKNKGYPKKRKDTKDSSYSKKESGTTKSRSYSKKSGTKSSSGPKRKSNETKSRSYSKRSDTKNKGRPKNNGFKK